MSQSSAGELTEQNVFVDDHFGRVSGVAAGSCDEALEHLRVLGRRVRDVQVAVGLRQQATARYRVRCDVEPRHHAVRHLHLQRAARYARNRARSAAEYVL